MQNPCELCKKKNKCPVTCFPKKDYLRALKKRNKKWTTQAKQKAY